MLTGTGVHMISELLFVIISINGELVEGLIDVEADCTLFFICVIWQLSARLTTNVPFQTASSAVMKTAGLLTFCRKEKQINFKESFNFSERFSPEGVHDLLGLYCCFQKHLQGTSSPSRVSASLYYEQPTT